MCASTSVAATPGNQCCTLAFKLHPPSSIFIILIFKHPHLNLRYMAASKQTNRHTHACVQCSNTSVGLAQAHPNYIYLLDTFGWF